MTARRRKVFAATLVIIFLAIPLWQGFEKPALPMDEGFLLVYPESILKGYIPYRDFETFYGPASPYLLSGVFAVFSPSIFTERVVGLGYRLLLFVAVFGLAQRWGTIIAAGCTALTGLLLVSSGIVAYAWLGAVALGLCSLWLVAKTDNSWRSFFGGICAGGALLYRVDLGPAILVATLPLFLAMPGSSRARWLAGAAIALLPLGALMLIAGPKPLFENLFLFPVMRSGPARHLPITSAEPAVIYLLGAHVVAVLVNLVAGVMAVRHNPKDLQNRVLLGWALFGLGLTHQAMQRVDSLHVLYAAFVSLGLLPLSILILMKAGQAPIQRSKALLAATAALSMVTLVLPELAIRFRNELFSSLTAVSDQSVLVENAGRSFPISSAETARSVTALLQELDKLSARGQRIFVGPADLRRTNYNDTYLYHLLPLLEPATYFLEMNPLSANRPDSRLPHDVESADWLVLNRRWDSWNEANRSREFGSDAANAVVRQHFILQGEFGSFLLFRKKQG
jgi:hypothetical protein